MWGKKHISLFLITAIIITMVMPDYGNFFSKNAKAEEVDSSSESNVEDTQERAVVSSKMNMRFIFTTDIHGQVVNYDYQTGKKLNRGLNQAYTLIQDARDEVGNSNYLTFDIGDSVMDFNTDYIYSQDTESLQPVYNAMTKIGYDALTLGNHDFDFGYDYIVNQMELSGLMKLCVLSNVKSSINGASVFGSENKIIEKKIYDKTGKEFTVKVGLVGETSPSLSTRTESYKKILTTEDIVANTTKEAALLKSKGADIVVVLAHSGFGTENPANKAADTAYALTKIPDVDVVLAGHEHIDFPAASKSDIHYSLPGVDAETGLVNGKRLVMLRDSCRGIGVVDLGLSIDENNKVTLEGSDYEIRKVTEDVAENEEITATMSSWDKKLKEYCQKKIGNIKEGENWNNYFSLLEGNKIMQTVHNAQLEYASNYIAQNAVEYKDCPIVSMTRYTKYGSESGSDYSNLSGTIVEGNADSFANYHRYVYIYKMTGAQLKECLEWSASIYQTVNTSSSKTWSNLVLNDYINKYGGNSLVQEEYIAEWNRFFQFDGVEYTIDPSVEPRYDYDGKRINDTRRITEVTRNGVPVTDDQIFVLVTDKITPILRTEANEGITDTIISKSHVILQDIVQRYLAEKALIGDIDVTVNRNWKLKLPNQYKFMFISGVGSEQESETKKWYKRIYDKLANFVFYECENINDDNQTDTDAPGLVLSVDNNTETNSSVNISVIANDISGIAVKKYAYGVFDKDSEVWQDNVPDVQSTEDSKSAESEGADNMAGTDDVQNEGSTADAQNTESTQAEAVEDNAQTVQQDKAANITGNSFVGDKNGVYSVYIQDGAGNVTVDYIAVTNIYPERLLKPTVNKVDNNDVKVTGNADPNLQIYIKSGSKIYEGKVGVDGQYSVKISPQKAKKKLYVYVTDNKGRKSKSASTVVKRVGPNCPAVTSAKNNETVVTGKTNDTNVKMYAVIDGNVYVSKSLGSSYYLKCKKYNKELTIKKTKITVNSSGVYSITIPNQYAGVKVKVFTVDALGRVSYGKSVKISKTAPNRATVYMVSNAERYVYGYIPDGTNAKVAVKVNSKEYRGKADEQGYFTVSVGSMPAGKTISVYGYKKASDGKIKKGYAKNVTVQNIDELYKSYKDTDIRISKVTDKDRQVKGACLEADTKIYICADGKEYRTTTDEEGAYSVNLAKRMKVGSSIYAILRSTKGGIRGMRKYNVVLGAPKMPVLAKKVTRKSNYIKLYTKELCTVVVKIGNRRYVKNNGTYNSKLKYYVYTIKIKRAKRGEKIRAYAKNKAGRSDIRTNKVA